MPKTKSLSQWIEHWLTCHEVGIDLGLTRIREVWQRLGAPTLAKQQVITVAGTNGKGSSVKMLALILAEKGYRVGTFTSPHIHLFNERITFYDAAQISQVTDAQLTRAFERIEQARGDITLSYFEAIALAAFLCFADNPPDVTILEVGLGGRLDAVNIIDADAALITSISIDHEAYLGNDINGIAREKAGVVRSGQVSVFSASNMPDAIVDEAAKVGAYLTYYSRDFELQGNTVVLHNARFTLPENFTQFGQFQRENVSGVLELLTRLGGVNASDEELVRQALSTFSLAGRFEVVLHEPLIVLDVAHNEDSLHALKATLANYPCAGKRFAVVGMLGDKAHRKGFAQVVDAFDEWHLASLTGERGFSSDDLASALSDVAPDAKMFTHDSVSDAIQLVQTKLSKDDQLIIFGSFVTVEEAKNYFK